MQTLMYFQIVYFEYLVQRCTTFSELSIIYHSELCKNIKSLLIYSLLILVMMQQFFLLQKWEEKQNILKISNSKHLHNTKNMSKTTY